MSQSTRYPNKGNWSDWHPPFEFLPSCYVPNHDDDNDYTRRMPLLSYGIGFNRSDAVEFVRDHNLLTKYEQELDAKGPVEYYDSIMATVEHIIRQAKLPGAKLAYPLFKDYEFVLEMWMNYNMRGVRHSYHRDLKTQVKRASELFGGRPVLWWWTVNHSHSRTGEEWPSSWLCANLVAPQYRERLGPQIWAIWNERFAHLGDVRGLDVEDPELDEEYEDEDDEEEEEDVLVDEEDDNDNDDNDIGEAVEVDEARTGNHR